MSHALTPYYKRIIRRQISTGREDLEELLLESLNDGKSVRMTDKRRKRIYRLALGGN